MKNYEIKNGYVTMYKGDNSFMQNYGEKVVMPVEKVVEIVREIESNIVISIEGIDKKEERVEKEEIKKEVEKKIVVDKKRKK